MRRSQLRSDPETVRAFVDRGRRRGVSPASDEQRRKVRDRCCVNCGGIAPCDPAHLCPRSLGGCDDADCVIPLCRSCHREFDEGMIDLEPVLALRQFAAERAHMALHLSYRQCIQVLSGERP